MRTFFCYLRELVGPFSIFLRLNAVFEDDYMVLSNFIKEKRLQRWQSPAVSSLNTLRMFEYINISRFNSHR